VNFEGKNPLKRVVSPQTPLFLIVKVFGKRGVKPPLFKPFIKDEEFLPL